MINTERQSSSENDRSETSQNVTDTSGEPIEAQILAAIRPKSADPTPEPEGEVVADETTDRGEEWDLEEPEHQRAWAALQRDGMTEEMIHSLGLKNALVLGRKRQKVQRDYDKHFGTKSAADESNETVAGHQAATEIDIVSIFKPVSETLGLDEAESKTVLQVLADAVRAEVSRAVEPYQRTALALAQDSEKSAWAGARKELLERIPQLADNDSFMRVKARAERLAKAGEAEGLVGQERLKALLHGAARLEFEDLPSKAEIERKKKLDGYKSVTANTPNSNRKKTAPSDPQERILEAIRLQKSGLSRNEIMTRLA